MSLDHLLAPQSDTLSRLAFRDFNPNPIPLQRKKVNEDGNDGIKQHSLTFRRQAFCWLTCENIGC